MNAGQLRHRVIVEDNDGPTNDVYGQLRPAKWTKFADHWCAIEPLSGEELFAAQHVEAGVTHRVTMRFLDGLSPRMRIVDGNRTLNILRVIDRDERHIEHELLCREVVS